MITAGYYTCENSNCNSWRVTKELDLIEETETGARYLRYPDEEYCTDCKHTMVED